MAEVKTWKSFPERNQNEGNSRDTHAATLDVKFTVVAFFVGHNTILGWIALHAFGAVTVKM